MAQFRQGRLVLIPPEAMNAALPKNDYGMRIGVILDGRILDEMICRRSVTIGSGRGNTIRTMKGMDLPERTKLITYDPINDQHTLHFTEEMGGRVNLGDGLRGSYTLAELRECNIARRRGAFWELTLSPRTKGKILLIGPTVLFECIPLVGTKARRWYERGMIGALAARLLGK